MTVLIGSAVPVLLALQAGVSAPPECGNVNRSQWFVQAGASSESGIRTRARHRDRRA